MGYQDAERHERELTDRQRHVLDLIASGHTNPQIAEDLGITLDGAKWNVSEVLTKLGLGSREEAGEYWRWRRRPAVRMSRALRALVGLPVVLKAGAAVAVAGVGVVAAVWWFAADEPEGPGETVIAVWHLEAKFYERRELAAWKYQAPEDADRGTLRLWFVDDTHYRIEVEYSHATPPGRGGVWIADGEALILYDASDNWYRRLPVEVLRVAGPLGQVKSLGQARQTTVLELVEGYKRTQPGDWIHSDAVLAGQDTILGVPVVVIEYSPTWVNGEELTHGGTGRLWVDPRRMLVLKATTEANDGTEASSAEVTRVAFDVEISADLVKFQPPSGACDAGRSEPPATDTERAAWLKKTCGR